MYGIRFFFYETDSSIKKAIFHNKVNPTLPRLIEMINKLTKFTLKTGNFVQQYTEPSK